MTVQELIDHLDKACKGNRLMSVEVAREGEEDDSFSIVKVEEGEEEIEDGEMSPVIQIITL
jgi:hypothetical protein